MSRKTRKRQTKKIGGSIRPVDYNIMEHHHKSLECKAKHCNKLMQKREQYQKKYMKPLGGTNK